MIRLRSVASTVCELGMLAGKVVLIDWKRWRVISLVKTCSYHSYWRSFHSECNCRSQKFVPIKKVQELKVSTNLNAWLLFTHLTEGYFCNILFWIGADSFHFRTAVRVRVRVRVRLGLGLEKKDTAAERNEWNLTKYLRLIFI